MGQGVWKLRKTHRIAAQSALSALDTLCKVTSKDTEQANLALRKAPKTTRMHSLQSSSPGKPFAMPQKKKKKPRLLSNL